MVAVPLTLDLPLDKYVVPALRLGIALRDLDVSFTWCWALPPDSAARRGGCRAAAKAWVAVRFNAT